jgi:hypothetical protein
VEVVVAYVEVLLLLLAGGTEESQENVGYCIQHVDRNSNLIPPEYEVRVRR